MSAPLLKLKCVARLACLAWALSLVVATAAPAKDDHRGPEAPPAAQLEQAPVIDVATPSPVPHQEIAEALRPCSSLRLLAIRLRHPGGTTFHSATVTLNGTRIATRRGKRITAPIDLRGLPKGTYKVVIRAVTTKGKVLRGTRTYHTCVGPVPHRAPEL